jgi:hypothetical protein
MQQYPPPLREHPAGVDPGGPSRPRRTRGLGASLVALLALGAVVVVLAACGAAAQSPGVATLNDPSAAPSGSPSASVDPEEAMQAFASCMRDHGVKIDVGPVDKIGGTTGSTGNGDGGGNVQINGSGTDKHKFDEAQKACGSLLPRGGTNGGPQPMDQETQDKLLAFSKCMREHGIDMPDPVFTDGGATVQIGGDGDNGPKIDPESSKFKAAQTACSSLLPNKGGGPVTGTGPTQAKP